MSHLDTEEEEDPYADYSGNEEEEEEESDKSKFMKELGFNKPKRKRIESEDEDESNDNNVFDPTSDIEAVREYERESGFRMDDDKDYNDGPPEIRHKPPPEPSPDIEPVPREDLLNRGGDGLVRDAQGNPINPPPQDGRILKPGEEPFYPAVFFSDDWTQEDAEEEESENPEYCFFCECSQNKADYENDANYHKLLRYCEENYGKVEPKRFSYNVQLYYNDHLRLNVVSGSNAMRRRVIHEHFILHCGNPKFLYEEQLRGHYHVAHTIKKYRLLKISEWDGRYDIDPKYYAMFCKSGNEIIKFSRLVEKHRSDKLF